MSLPNWKAYIDYTGYIPYHLAEILGLAGIGVESDPIFINKPVAGVALKGFSTAILTTHSEAVAGGEKEQAAFEKALAEGQAAMHLTGVFANSICAGDKELLIKIRVPYYDASTPGRASSTFSLVNGPASGELVITVPIVRKDDSYIAIYSLDADTLVEDYKVAGGNSHCKFSLLNLPVGTKIWVRWAVLNAMGIGVYSEPYPIIVT